jgi:hypothetical protein
MWNLMYRMNDIIRGGVRTGIVAASLLATTSLALAQAPPPGGGGSGGGGGNQPTITWSYSGTKTIINGNSTQTTPVQSASDLTAVVLAFFRWASEFNIVSILIQELYGRRMETS